LIRHLQPGLNRSARLFVFLVSLSILVGCMNQPVTLPPLPVLVSETPPSTPTLTLEPHTATATPTPLLIIPTVTPTATVIPPTATPYPQITLMAVGDVMMGRMVNKLSLEQNDYSWPFTSIGGVLANADLTIGNLESALVPYCPVDGISMRLCGSTRAAQALDEAGFDIMGFSNNHSQDYGPEGHATTVDALSEVGLATVYDGVPWLGEINGIRIVIFAYNDVNRDLDLERARLETASFAQQADVVIGMIHWGYEYRPNPSQRQIEMAHVLADAGMRVIIGSHPHWIQPIDEYGNTHIFYSLGNFVFDQTWSEKTRQGLMVKVTIVKTVAGTELSYEMIPIRIDGYGEPQLIDSVPIPTLTP
jgi:gamma-polyglutamate biosynthesis protein CapA